MAAERTTALLAQLSNAPPLWAEQLQRMEPRAAQQLAHELLTSWTAGELELALLRERYSDLSIRKVRRELATAFTAMAGAGLEPEVESRNLSPDESIARRWCWIEGWLLMSQDEDLLLMDEKLYEALLDEAGAGCPKREYAIGIVSHAIRDAAHAALRRGPEYAREQLAKSTQWAVQAQRAGAGELADYCERLASYSQGRRVDETQAAQRARDLSRCSPLPTPAPQLRTRHWSVVLSTHGNRIEQLHVEVASGQMHIAEG